MKAFILIAVFFASGPTLAGELSYDAWKGKRVSEAKSLVGQISNNIRKIKNNSEKRKLEMARLEQAKLNVDIAKELSAADYFVLYLSSRFSGDRRAFTRAVKGLKTKDMVDILLAYEAKLQQKVVPEEVDSVQFLLPRTVPVDHVPASDMKAVISAEKNSVN